MKDTEPVVFPSKFLGLHPDKELRVIICPFCLEEVIAGTIPGALAWSRAHVKHCPVYRINALRFMSVCA